MNCEDGLLELAARVRVKDETSNYRETEAVRESLGLGLGIGIGTLSVSGL